MKLWKRQENGRTMVEMIGVLVIIGLLSVGGMTGYSYLVQRHRRQEAVKEVSQLVLGIKASNASRKYGDGNVIPAEDFIRGPEMTEGAMKLGDGENSYAMVTQLANGAFALGLQLEPGTCQEFVKAMSKDEEIIMFDPKVKHRTDPGQLVRELEDYVRGSHEGYKLLSQDPETKGDREGLIKLCNEGAFVAWVFGCSLGSSSYGHLLNIQCTGCKANEELDSYGKCCGLGTKCGNRCECPSGEMCDQKTGDPNGRCVPCSLIHGEDYANDQCKKAYHTFAKHVCHKEGEETNNTCVECNDKNDCEEPLSTGEYKDWEKYRGKTFAECVDHKCVECTKDEDCEGNKVCEKGVCTECPEGQHWDETKRQCVCDNGVKNKEGVCVYCIDDRTDSGKDTGCEDSSKRVCSNEKGTSEFGKGGTMKNGETCYQCVIDENCKNQPDEKDACYPENHECVFCVNNEKTAAPDSGCKKDPDKPLCAVEEDFAGTTCKHCQNTEEDENQTKDKIDLGCKSSAPVCMAEAGEFGDECKVCKDTYNHKDDKGIDAGCSTEKKLCGREEPGGGYGDACYKCATAWMTDEKGNNYHVGCDAEHPFCQAESGKFGNVCKSCQELDEYRAVWDNASKTCIACKDTATGTNKDTGCDSGKYAGLQMCGAWENTGNGKTGDYCGTCIDDKDMVGIDTGCTGQGSKHICVKDTCGDTRGSNGARTCWHNHASNEVGTRCVECIFDGHCYALDTTEKKPICDNKGPNATFTCQPCPDPTKQIPVWNNNNHETVLKCVECLTPADCPSNKPVCDTSTNTCKACPPNQPIWNGTTCVECRTDADCTTGDKKWCENNVCVACVQTLQDVRITDFASGHMWYAYRNHATDNWEWKITRESNGTYTCRHNLRWREWHDYGNFSLPAGGWLYLGIEGSGRHPNESVTVGHVYRNYTSMANSDRVVCGYKYYTYTPLRCKQ